MNLLDKIYCMQFIFHLLNEITKFIGKFVHTSINDSRPRNPSQLCFLHVKWVKNVLNKHNQRYAWTTVITLIFSHVMQK